MNFVASTIDNSIASHQDYCRICMNPEVTIENPLISICKCSGSMKFIHYECLKAWMDTKLRVNKIGEVHTYYWKTYMCEVCKTNYPRSLKQHLFQNSIEIIL